MAKKRNRSKQQKPRSGPSAPADTAAPDKPPDKASDKAIERSKQRNKRKQATKDAGASHAARVEKARQAKADRQQAREARDKVAAQTRGKNARPLPEARIANQTMVADPELWFGFEVTWAKLALARIVIFSLLAIDALLLFRHAPRYGANDFNVGQLAIFDGIGPGRVAYGGGQLLLAYLFVLVAFGVATRVLVPVTALLYGWLYFGSQLDSYQHHYLVVLVLAIASFVPWRRPDDATPETRVASPAVRVLLIQLAVLYLWAAISKLHPAWIDGSTLASQLTGGIRLMIAKTIGFPVASVLVILTELTLAATVWWKRGWRVAAPLGVLFHGGILASDLEIGLFAVLMLGFYILVVPDGIWVWLAETPTVVSIRASLRRLATRTSWAIFAATVLFGIGAAKFARFEDAIVVALVGAAISVVLAAAQRGAPPSAVIGIAHATAIALWLVVDRTSTVAVDYYRYWGGSQRRLQDFEQAETAYRSMVEIAPSDPVGHFQLGRILVTRPGASDPQRVAEGLAELRVAQQLEPTSARSFVEEARVLASQGHTAEALVKAKQGAFAEPSDPEARAIVDSLSNSQAAPAPAPESDSGEQ